MGVGAIKHRAYAYKVEIATAPGVEDDVFEAIRGLGDTPAGPFDDLVPILVLSSNDADIVVLLRGWGWTTDFQDDTGVLTFRWPWAEESTWLENDGRLFKAIAPFVVSGSRYIFSLNARLWRWGMSSWVFDGQSVAHIPVLEDDRCFR